MVGQGRFFPTTTLQMVRVLKKVFSSFSYMLSDVLISSDMGWKLEILRIKSDYVRRFGFFIFFSV